MTPTERQIQNAKDMRAMSKAEMRDMSMRNMAGMMNDTRTPQGLENEAIWCSNPDHLRHFVEPPKPTLWQRIKLRIGL